MHSNDRLHQIIRYVLFLCCGIFVFISWGCDSNNNDSEVLFEDNFEAATCLDKWEVGGRQTEGANIADCVIHRESMQGHLFKSSVTEVTLAPEVERFPFSRGLTFNFDMELRTSSSGGALDSFYGSSGVNFDFFSSDDEPLGNVSFMSATTQFPFDNVADDSTKHAVRVEENEVISYSLSTEELLTQISIDESAISYVRMNLWAYSSTRPFPTVEAELWIDNVFITD